MKFSIIIPSYNTEKANRAPMLEELIASVPDRDDVEIVVVDDHSPLSVDLVAPHTKTSLRLERNLPDRKYAGTARNTGMELASGEFLIFADSDDRFRTETLAEIMDEISRSDDGFEVAVFHISSFDDQQGGLSDRHDHYENVLEFYKRHPKPDSMVRFHLPYGRIVRRDFVEKHGLRYDDTRVGNDIFFGVQVGIFARHVRVFDQIAYEVRRHEASLIADESDEADLIRLRIYARANRLMREHGLFRRFSVFDYLRRYKETNPSKWRRLVMKAISIPGSDFFKLPQKQRKLKSLVGQALVSIGLYRPSGRNTK